MTTTANLRSFQRVLHDFLDPTDAPPLERAFNALLAGLIVVNVALMVWATVPGVQSQYAPLLAGVARASLIVFTLEYLGRLWTAPLAYPQLSPARARAAFMLSPLALVDLLVLFALGVPTLGDWAPLKALRLLKLLSLLKLGRYSAALQLIGKVVSDRRNELVTTVMIVVVLVLFAATLLYHAEHATGAKCFESIPASMWWAIVTLTTTGYGDCFPATFAGKALSSGIMLLAVGIVALPAGLIASGFAEELARRRAKPTCPHCGEPLTD